MNLDFVTKTADVFAAFGADGPMLAERLEQTFGCEAAFRPWRNTLYGPCERGPALEVLARFAADDTVTRVEYRFGKRSGGDGVWYRLRRVSA